MREFVFPVIAVSFMVSYWTHKNCFAYMRRFAKKYLQWKAKKDAEEIKKSGQSIHSFAARRARSLETAFAVAYIVLPLFVMLTAIVSLLIWEKEESGLAVLFLNALIIPFIYALYVFLFQNLSDSYARFKELRENAPTWFLLYQHYLKAAQIEVACFRSPDSFALVRESEPYARNQRERELNLGMLYFLFDLERTHFVYADNALHINYKVDEVKLRAFLHSGRCVYAREVVGMLGLENDVDYDESTQTVYLDVWNDGPNELNRERLRSVRRVVVDSPRADFPYDWAVSALLEAVETENLQIELEIPHPERLSENTKRVLREKGRLQV